MVFTLHRYIFRELFKVFILAAVALTLMLSLGSILRPIQEYGAGPRQVLHLMGYFLPITLTFVLPMAALFAASLVYGRFAGDNELDACRASGVSLLTLVYPGLALAIMVAIANLILSFYVTPTFVQRAEKSLKADAKQIVFRNIQRKGYYRPPGGQYLIYAEQANPQNDILLGVVITEVEGNKIKKIIAAESAKVKFNPHKIFNEVQVTAYNTFQMGSEDEGAFSMKWVSLSKEFPTLMGDDIKFKKIGEIKKIQVDPMLFLPVAKLARETYSQFIAELLAQDIVAKITGGQTDNTVTAADGGKGFYKLYSGQKLVEFTANQCVARSERKIELLGEVTVRESDVASRRFLQTLHAQKASLYIEGDELAPTLTMEIYNANWRRADNAAGLSQRHIIRGLILPKNVTDELKTEDVLNTVSTASIGSALKKGPTPMLAAVQSVLLKKIQRTLFEIQAEMHSRLVFGIGCVSMVLIGIGLGIMKKGGHLLSAFGASCIPAAVLIVCIMMGKNVAKNQLAHAGSGLLLMWIGLVLLSLLAVYIFRKLLKN